MFIYGSPKIKTNIDIPMVTLTPKAAAQMRALTDLCPLEVSWFGNVEDITVHDQRIFLVDEIYIPKQEVSSGTTDVDVDCIEGLAEEILEMPNGEDRISKMRLWGHSHANMGVSPSTQDETQMVDFSKTCDYMIMLIMNKKGEARIDIGLFSLGITIENANWFIMLPDEEAIRTEMKAIMDKRITEKTYTQCYGKWNKKTKKWEYPKNTHTAINRSYSEAYGYNDRYEYGDEYDGYDEQVTDTTSEHTALTNVKDRERTEALGGKPDTRNSDKIVQTALHKADLGFCDVEGTVHRWPDILGRDILQIKAVIRYQLGGVMLIASERLLLDEYIQLAAESAQNLMDSTERKKKTKQKGEAIA